VPPCVGFVRGHLGGIFEKPSFCVLLISHHLSQDIHYSKVLISPEFCTLIHFFIINLFLDAKFKRNRPGIL
jgi:hypothetical protein